MDLRKLKDKAIEAYSKGRFAKAAELYDAYCTADPKDLQARLRMGDAWAKAGGKGARDKAIDAYRSAAEGFAKEGFLPRAIAASKLILELDPAHQGVQQMLASLYANKTAGGGLKRTGTTRLEMPAVSVPATAPSSKYAPIELPPDDGPVPEPLEADGGVDLDIESSGPRAIPPAVVDRSSELPPELDLQLASEPKVEAKPAEKPALHPVAEVLELELNEPAPPAASTLPPGLRPKRAQESIVELTAKKAPVPAPAPNVPEVHEIEVEVELEAAAAPEPAAQRAQSRIWLPGSFASSAAPEPPRVEVAPSGYSATSPARPQGRREVERTLQAFSKFDVDLEVDVRPAPEPPPRPAAAPRLTMPGAAVAPPPQIPAVAPAVSAAPPEPKAPAVRIPTFTELELDGDSLLHAVEMAAAAGMSQRGQDAAAPQEELAGVEEEPQAEGAVAGLPKIPLFSDLPADAFIELFERCPLKRYTTGDRILEQGSVGDAFYVICAGSVRVLREEAGKARELAKLPEGSFFGEMALLSGAARSASVEADAEETQVLEISAPVLAQLSVRYPQVAQALKKFTRQRLLNNVMSTSALFKMLDKKLRKVVIERFRARDVKRGDAIIQEGAEADGLYVILSGEVEVRKAGVELARLKEGEMFGEMSLLQKTPATATVSAAKRTSLLRLPRADFDGVVISNPHILALLAEISDTRRALTEQAMANAGTSAGGEEDILLV